MSVQSIKVIKLFFERKTFGNFIANMARGSIEELKCTLGDVFDQEKWAAGLS